MSKRVLDQLCSGKGASALAAAGLAALAVKLQKLHATGELDVIVQQLLNTRFEFNLLTALAVALAAGLVLLYRAVRQSDPVYLVDFAMALPPEEWKFPKQHFLKASACNPLIVSAAAAWGAASSGRGRSLSEGVLLDFSKDDMEFQERIVYRSGLGDETTCPPCEILRWG
ncbi:hypothetical protein MNEG_12771 [Monoraphidium neglectum]|uniref:Uncharacterized protein n=1 Tax=Monoraphidium neglectum TaxID=145388 RepID=A0A0D2MJS5_9CHLO|nr:hypothetical protein MNEG_12771 [Monoraphidium neglectum]KIY95190.1 hypothetical protein MNEG_12771 [Monoraphidium neglectum]|eukprot:XP_013894210.1 hypothetical protein MNEG_12771 [Monoraphidium neglectum]